MTAVIISGVTYGVFYVLMAMGIAIVERYVSLLNFAQGAVATLTAYLMFGVLTDGMPYYPAAVVAIAGGIASSMLMGLAIIKWFAHATHLTRTMATLGPSLALVGAVGIIWDQDLHSLPAPPGFGSPIVVAGHAINSLAVLGLGILIAFVLGFQAMLRYTKLGLALRAMSDDPVVAQAYGIQVNRLQVLVWGIAGALAALSALVITPANQLDPNFLTNFLIMSFTAVVLGGVGSISGLVGGGLVFGLLISLAQYRFDGEITGLAALAVLLVALTFRPSGLFSAFQKELKSSTGLDHIPAGAGRARFKLGRLSAASWRPARVVAMTSRIRAAKNQASRAFGGPAVRVGVFVGTVVLAALVLPAVVAEPDLYAIATAIAMVVAVSGQNIASGLSGQLSLAQGGVMLVASYVAAIAATEHGVAPLGAMAIAVVVSAAIGVVLSAAAARVSGVYLAVITMCFSISIPELARNLSDLTNGEIGMFTGPLTIGSRTYFTPKDVFLVTLVLSSLALAILYGLSRSRFGKLWRAARDSSDAAKATGVSIAWPRIGAFAVSCAAGGFAGSLMTFQAGIVSPGSFLLITSINILLAAALGGEESVVVGPVIGAFLIVLLPHLLSEQGTLASVIFGTAMFLFLAIRSRTRRGSVVAVADPAPEVAPTPHSASVPV